MPTPLRSLRVSDELWKRAQKVADERGETLADVMRAALERYAKRHGE